MKNIDKINGQENGPGKTGQLIAGIVAIIIIILTAVSCDDSDCEYIEQREPPYLTTNECPGFVDNGDFEIVTGNPNASVDQDIDLATGWGALWQNGSLADLFDASTTNFGSSSFVAPAPASGVFAGMWVENSSNGGATYREGMFNKLTNAINASTGIYTLSFDYAKMSTASSNDVKVGVYGVYFTGTSLPANPTSINTPPNTDLFGTANAVLLGEVVISNTTTNTWASASFTFDSSSITMPASGNITHVMITNSHVTLPDFGRMFVGFDNFCLINE
ncbi:MAG: hypothetical protein CL868_18495 [Cytophagaceae bacterium]|nr:hypothetical protein [Cytophagaceae bacterium]|tara:strand:- start:5811 stop:6638 length:828 start_codon:yes stop_codon:yes gene_type:complete